MADNGWKILLDRGLDIFQQYDMNDTLQLQTAIRNLERVRRLK